MSMRKSAKSPEESMVIETWESLVLHALYREDLIKEPMVFKGGSALRLLYGSDRMSGDLDFDSFSISGLPPKTDEAPGETAQRIERCLRGAADLLNAFGFKKTTFSLVKKGEGTVRFKTSAEISLPREDTLSFNSKVEISRRLDPGLRAVAEKYGVDSIETTIEFTPSMGEAGKKLGAPPPPGGTGVFVKAYTPLALFLMKTSAVMSPSRHSTRDVYDMAYIWSRLGLGDKGRQGFLMDCIQLYMDGLTPAKKDTLLSLLEEKATRFVEEFENDADLNFYGGKDLNEAGLLVLEFLDEFTELVNSFPEDLSSFKRTRESLVLSGGPGVT